MKTLDVLKNVRKLFEDPNKWTSGRYTSEKGFCVKGACLKETNAESFKHYKADWYKELKITADSMVSAETEVCKIVYINDALGYEAVLKLLDLTIERLEKQ